MLKHLSAQIRLHHFGIIHSLLIIFSLLSVKSGLAYAPSPANELRVIGYFSSWAIYAPQYDITQIPASQLTHINYAFANISETGECLLGDEYADTQYPYADGSSGNMGALVNLKAANPHLKTLISVGGYTWSGRFSDVAATSETRQHFASSCINFMLQHGFDGLDIDWEFPVGKGAYGNSQRPEDSENFVLLLQALRDQLSELSKTQGQTYLLTIASGSTGEQYAALDWNRIYPLLDWINVMTYDMSGAQDGTTGLNAPLYTPTSKPAKPSIDRTITDLLAFGIPPEKLVMGVPFYGVGWTGVNNDNQGLYQPYAKLADGTLGPGYFDYAGIISLTKVYPSYWDENAYEPWLYDSQSGTFVSYEDANSMNAKIVYLKAHGLGGVMICELSMDDDNHTLMNALFEALNGSST